MQWAVGGKPWCCACVYVCVCVTQVLSGSIPLGEPRIANFLIDLQPDLLWATETRQAMSISQIGSP